MSLAHFFDGLFVAIPATVGAVAALVAARNTGKTRKEVKSPNGTTTGQAVHDLRQAVDGIATTVKSHDTRITHLEAASGRPL